MPVGHVDPSTNVEPPLLLQLSGVGLLIQTTPRSNGGSKSLLSKRFPPRAGNSSGVNDGAAMVMLTTRGYAQQAGLTPLATFKSFASAGVDPEVMGVGPVPACKRALEKVRVRSRRRGHNFLKSGSLKSRRIIQDFRTGPKGTVGLEVCWLLFSYPS